MTFSRRTGFTLLEICLALLIAGMLILLAVPGIGGVLAEQRLKQSFERFDALVAVAKRRSVTEQRSYAIVWEKNGVTLAPAGSKADAIDKDRVTRLPFEQGEKFELRRTAALRPDAPGEWIFWSNGLCEPAQVSFQGKAGAWLVSYDPLTAHGTFLKSDVP